MKYEVSLFQNVGWVKTEVFTVEADSLTAANEEAGKIMSTKDIPEEDYRLETNLLPEQDSDEEAGTTGDQPTDEEIRNA